MSTIAKWLYSFGVFLIGWAAGGLLDEGVETLSTKDGRCKKKYTMRNVPDNCINCMTCYDGMERLKEVGGINGSSVGSINDHDLAEILDEIAEACPVDIVTVEIECTVEI